MLAVYAVYVQSLTASQNGKVAGAINYETVSSLDAYHESILYKSEYHEEAKYLLTSFNGYGGLYQCVTYARLRTGIDVSGYAGNVKPNTDKPKS